MKIELNENALWSVAVASIALVVIAIAFAVSNYNATVAQAFFKAGYSEVQNIGDGSVRWVKP